MDTVTVGCRLPQGYTLEVGLVPPVVKDGRLVARHKQKPDYAICRLKGTNQHSLQQRILTPSSPPPAMANLEPWMNAVPADFWERWKKEYSTTWAALNRQGALFEVKGPPNGNEAKAATLDAMAKPDAFAPMNPVGDIRASKVIKKANFDE
jgi:hypothetical protein